MRIAGRKAETPQSLQVRMAHHTFHQPDPEPFAAEFFENIHIAQIGIGRTVGDNPRKSDLLLTVEQAEAE